MAVNNITDMNDHCLIEIFKYLDNVGLMALSLTTKRFRQLVINDVVPQIIYDLDSASWLAFGKRATKISRNLFGSPLEQLFDDIQHHCAPGLLTHVQVWYASASSNLPMNQDQLERTARYLGNLKTLRCFLVDQFNEWLTSIPGDKMRTLVLHLRGTHDFRLIPESFPHLLDCTVLIDGVRRMETYAGHRERYNAVIEFIKRKPKLRKLSYRDHSFHEQTIFRTVSENCLNITSLGILKIRNDVASNNWNFLKKCQHLNDVTMQISIFNGRKFADIFQIICDMRQLKVLHIDFNQDEKIDAKTAIDEIASFLKSNNGYRKVDTLQYIELSMDIDVDDNVLQQICVMVASVFRATTLHSSVNQHPDNVNSKYISAIVHNLHGLEHLSLDEDCFSEVSIPLTWTALMEAKISLNTQLSISAKLIIYVDKKCEHKLKTALINCYDHTIITIASEFSFVFNNCKFWHW